MGGLFRPHRLGDLFRFVPKHRLLLNFPALLQDVGLPSDFRFHRPQHGAETVQVFDFHAGAQLLATFGAQGDGRFKAQLPPLHPRLGNAQVKQQLPKVGHEGFQFFQRVHVGVGDDFAQRDATAVVVNQTRRRVTRFFAVHRFARVLFQVHIGDANPLDSAVDFYVQPAVVTEGQALLGNLVAFGQVGVVVVFALKKRLAMDVAVQRQSDLQRVVHRLLVDDGQNARKAQTNGTSGGVGRGVPDDGARAKHLALRRQLRVNFQADDRFPFRQRRSPRRL